MYFCNCRTAIAVTPFPDKLAFIWKELPGWGGSHLCMLLITHYYHQYFFITKAYQEHCCLMSVGHKRKVWKWWSVVWESLSEEPTGQLLVNCGSSSRREKKVKQEIVQGNDKITMGLTRASCRTKKKKVRMQTYSTPQPIQVCTLYIVQGKELNKWKWKERLWNK